MSVSAHSGDSKSVGVIGYGAVGRALASSILGGEIPGMHLGGGIMDRSGRVPSALRTSNVDDLIQRSDVIVEAAGPEALKSSARHILGAGTTLVALSIGAFLSDEIKGLPHEGHPGKLILSTGAIGGLDLIRAMAISHEPLTLTLSSRKRPASLMQPWMSQAERLRLSSLTDADAPEVIFAGNATEASELFPANLNVAAALEIAGGPLANLSIELIADPATERTVHHVSAESALGRCDFTVRNRPLSDNPATSSVTPWALLRCLSDLSPHTRTYYC